MSNPKTFTDPFDIARLFRGDMKLLDRLQHSDDLQAADDRRQEVCFFSQAIRQFRALRLSSKKPLPLHAIRPPRALPVGQRWRQTMIDRGPSQWVQRCQHIISRWREGSVHGCQLPLKLDPRDQRAATWIVQLALLQAQRFERRGRTREAWAIYADLLRSANDLRAMAISVEQAAFAARIEMHVSHQLRDWAIQQSVSAEDLQRAMEELDDIWQNAIELERLCIRQYAMDSDWQDPADKSLEAENEQRRDEQIRNVIGRQICTAWLIHWSRVRPAARAARFRRLQPSSTSTTLRILLEDLKSSQSPDLELRPDCQELLFGSGGSFSIQLVDTWLERLQSAAHCLDQCVANRNLTQAFLMTTLVRSRHGVDPASTDTMAVVAGQPWPEDPYAEQDRQPLGYRLTEGESLAVIRGQRNQNGRRPRSSRRDQIATHIGQPLIFSVAVDGQDDRGQQVWNGAIDGDGDWVLTIPRLRSPRRMLQIDLRNFLLAFIVISGWLGLRMSPPARLQAAVKAINKVGAEVEFVSDVNRSWLSRKLWKDANPISSLEIDSADQAAVIHLLPRLPQLTSLQIEDCGVLDEDQLRCIAQLTGLTSLTINNCEVPVHAWHELAGLKQLASLDLDDTNVSDDDLTHFQGFAKLIDLHVSDTLVSGRRLQLLQQLPLLTKLYLVNSPVDDDGLMGIGTLVNLDHLDIDSTEITGSGLAHLKNLTKLETLDIRSTPVTDEGFKLCPPLPALNKIYLNRTAITGLSLKHLQTLPEITSLYLCGCKLTDQDMEMLADIKRLTHIDLENNLLKGSGLRHLARLPDLASLDISEMRIKREFIDELEEQRPQLDVTH